MSAPKTAFEVWLAERNQAKSETSPVIFMERGQVTGNMADFRPRPIHDEEGIVEASPHSTTATPEAEEGKDDGEEAPVTPETPTSSATGSVPTSPGSILGDDLAGATAGRGASGPARVQKAKL